MDNVLSVKLITDSSGRLAPDFVGRTDRNVPGVGSDLESCEVEMSVVEGTRKNRK